MRVRICTWANGFAREGFVIDRKRNSTFIGTPARLGLIIIGLLMLGGCSSTPRMRVGAFFGSPGGMRYPDPARLGSHNYNSSRGERNGLAYTCSGGFIDIGHLREAADRTAYLADLVFSNLVSGEKDFSFRVIEPSLYHVTISYPAGWEAMSEEERAELAGEASILLGQYFAHKSLVWHEIVTWYGFSSTGIFSEKISSFSFEDTYSDATGVYLAGKALRDPRPYDDVMTELIDQRLKELGAQSPETARRAVNQISGQWYSGELYIFTRMKEPNFDVGLADGFVTPRLVPDICADAVPQPVPVPDLDAVSQLGFAFNVEIEPWIWEKIAIYKSISLDDSTGGLRPRTDFPEIIQYIANHSR
jgi:hypothetical protein